MSKSVPVLNVEVTELDQSKGGRKRVVLKDVTVSINGQLFKIYNAMAYSVDPVPAQEIEDVTKMFKTSERTVQPKVRKAKEEPAKTEAPKTESGNKMQEFLMMLQAAKAQGLI